MINAVTKFTVPKSVHKMEMVRIFKNSYGNDFVRGLSQIPDKETATIYDNLSVCWKVNRTFYLGVLDRHAPLRKFYSGVTMTLK